MTDTFKTAAMAIHQTDKCSKFSELRRLPLLSIVMALVYLKMRQLGGETLTDVMAQIETEGTHSKWEQRMRERLTTPRL